MLLEVCKGERQKESKSTHCGTVKGIRLTVLSHSGVCVILSHNQETSTVPIDMYVWSARAIKTLNSFIH